MTHGWQPASEPREDNPDSLREWRWRSYTDHLEDLGYDLDGGGEPDSDGPADRAAIPTGARRSRSTA